LQNAGAPAQVYITDTIPSLVTYVPGSATGGATYDGALNAVLWNGRMETGQVVAISFRVSGPFPTIPPNTPIINNVIINDGVHGPFIRSVLVIANTALTPTVTATPTRTATVTGTPTATPTRSMTPPGRPRMWIPLVLK